VKDKILGACDIACGFLVAYCSERLDQSAASKTMDPECISTAKNATDQHHPVVPCFAQPWYDRRV